jgi:5-methylcytosine-specific restriction protein A
MMPSKVLPGRQSLVRFAPKTADPFYSTPEWKATRQRIFRRDSFCCVVVGCGQRAIVCDHIVSRHDGGFDDDSNLRSLCRLHDNMFKEDALRRRRSGGGG